MISSTTTALPAPGTLTVATTRLKKELREYRYAEYLQQVFNLQTDQSLQVWTCLIVPENPPYNKAAFIVELQFPFEFPFKPPKVTFKTKVYHPNIDERGVISMPIIAPEHWKPATRVVQILNVLVALFDKPVLENALREDLVTEYKKDIKKFNRNAEEFTKKHGEDRPA